jgi:NAD(P)H-nitrite reductase large subunit
MPADFAGSDVQGVVSLYSMGDVRSMLKLVNRAKTAVVVGGGIIAIELAEGLAANRVQVDYFLRGDHFWSKILDQAESRLVERGLEQMGIRIHHHTQVAQTLSKQGVLTGVVTKTGEVFPCQILGVATGVLPQIELAVQAGLATDRGILVNEYLESNIADIFAAGDVARVRDSRTGEAWLETLWRNARRQGTIAGANMTGGRQVCEREATLNAVRIGDIITSTIGAVERMGDTDISMFVSSDKKIWEMYRHSVDMAHDDEICRVRVLVGQQIIVGAVVMGDQTPAYPLLQMIQEKTDLSLIHSRLADHPEFGVEEIVRFYQREQFPYVFH